MVTSPMEESVFVLQRFLGSWGLLSSMAIAPSGLFCECFVSIDSASWGEMVPAISVMIDAWSFPDLNL